MRNLRLAAAGMTVALTVVFLATYDRAPAEDPSGVGTLDLTSVRPHTRRFEELVLAARAASGATDPIVDSVPRAEARPEPATPEAGHAELENAATQRSIWRTLRSQPHVLTGGAILGSVEFNPFALEVTAPERDALSAIIERYRPVLAEMHDVSARIQGNEHAAHLEAGLVERYRMDEDPVLRESWAAVVQEHAAANGMAWARANEWLLRHPPGAFLSKHRMSVTSVAVGEDLAYPLHRLPAAHAADAGLRAHRLVYVGKLVAWAQAQGLVSHEMAMELLRRYRAATGS